MSCLKMNWEASHLATESLRWLSDYKKLTDATLSPYTSWSVYFVCLSLHVKQYV